MKLKQEQLDFFIHTIQEMQAIEELSLMHQFMQHGKTTTFVHCVAVAYTSYKRALGLPFHYDLKSIIRGSMLHDFYLYDWHIPHVSHRLHGFRHPDFAKQNARKHFILNATEEEIIETHMWPLTITKNPRHKEAVLVCLVDKCCSLAETFHLPTQSKEFRQIIKLLTASA